MIIKLDYFDDEAPIADEINSDVVDEIRRVATLIEQGFTSGELTAGADRGWWSIES